MNERLQEFVSLWNKDFADKATQPESQRLRELMQDPALMDEFTELQAESAKAEPVDALLPAQWTKIDESVKRGWLRFKTPLWARPTAWALVAAVLALAGYLEFSASDQHSGRYVEDTLAVDRYKEPVAQAEPEELEPAADTAPRLSPAKVTEREIKASKISLNVEQPGPGDLRIEIKNSAGAVVKKVYAGNVNKGQWHFEWNGLDQSGRPVSPGTYKVHIHTSAGETVRELEIRKKN